MIFMKKFSLFLLLIVSALLLISCNDKLVVNGVTIEKVSVHTDLQKGYFADDYAMISQYANGDKELSRPNPVVLEWNDSTKLKSDGKYKVFVSKNYDFSEAKIYYSDTNTLEIYNLEINVIYYWKVVGIETSDIFGFRIDGLVNLRNLYIDGITNARDLGGYPIRTECFVKQGMIYRTSKFNEDESTQILITEKGIDTLVNDLGVVVELDLRDVNEFENGGITESPLGNGVRYINISMKSGGNYLTLNKNVLKDVFSVLGDETNYPMVIHCSIGTDRTGLICFLINGLLGVSEQELYQDYLFSNFGYIYGVRTQSAINGYIKQMKYYGDDISDGIYNYLISQGVAKEDLDTIIRIMKTERIQPE